MVDLVQTHIPEIQHLCEKYKMKRVWLFGSAKDPQAFNENSDIDFLYEPDKSRMSIREFLDFPLYIQKELAELLGRPVDWIRYFHFRNPYFREEVEKTKLLIYEYDSKPTEVSV